MVLVAYSSLSLVAPTGGAQQGATMVKRVIIEVLVAKSYLPLCLVAYVGKPPVQLIEMRCCAFVSEEHLAPEIYLPYRHVVKVGIRCGCGEYARSVVARFVLAVNLIEACIWCCRVLHFHSKPCQSHSVANLPATAPALKCGGIKGLAAEGAAGIPHCRFMLPDHLRGVF